MENPLNNDLIIANCLSCQGLVRVPAKAAATSKVRCPHCTNSFVLSQILDQAVPELEMVEGSDLAVLEGVNEDPGSVTKDDRGRFVVPSQLRSGSKKRRSRHSSNSSRNRDSNSSRRDDADKSPIESSGSSSVERFEQPEADRESRGNEFSISESDTPRTSEPRSRSKRPRRSESSRETRSKRSRSSRSKKSTASGSTGVEVVKIVVGGFLAIPIAYLLVLWVFKQDPLQIAPTISETAPLVVPEKFRTTTDDESKSGNPDDEVDANKTDDNADPAGNLDNKNGGDETKVINNLDELPKPTVDPTKIKIK